MSKWAPCLLSVFSVFPLKLRHAISEPQHYDGNHHCAGDVEQTFADSCVPVARLEAQVVHPGYDATQIYGII